MAELRFPTIKELAVYGVETLSKEQLEKAFDVIAGSALLDRLRGLEGVQKALLRLAVAISSAAVAVNLPKGEDGSVSGAVRDIVRDFFPEMLSRLNRGGPESGGGDRTDRIVEDVLDLPEEHRADFVNWLSQLIAKAGEGGEAAEKTSRILGVITRMRPGELKKVAAMAAEDRTRFLETAISVAGLGCGGSGNRTDSNKLGNACLELAGKVKDAVLGKKKEGGKGK